jgi:hypothetical protein
VTIFLLPLALLCLLYIALPSDASSFSFLAAAAAAACCYCCYMLLLLLLLLLQFIKGDIQSMDLLSFVLLTEQIDTIMHFAAQVRSRERQQLVLQAKQSSCVCAGTRQ